MKNLKKTLAVVLAFAMILGMSAISTLAYTDVAEGTIVSEAVSILSNLEILTGFEDGTFRPSETVTRAQMAAIICRVLGYEEQAESSKGSTIFNDVAADHWAAGYINVAQAQQIINGYGDGNYGPEDKVTYEQAVKMIVSALGYDLPAQDKGGYPTGYLAIASTKGITKNANGRVGDAAARSTIAVLTYNALEVELMDQTSWSTGASGNEYGKTGETVLSRYLGVKKYEGVVTTTPLTDIVDNGYDPEAKAVVGFDALTLKAWGFSAGNYTLQSAALAGNVNADLVKDADKYLGKKVVAYIGTEADAETGDVMVYALAEKQGANATLKINATELVADAEENKLVYKTNSKKEAKLNLTDVYVNYAVETELEKEFDENLDGDNNDATGTDILTTKDFDALLTNGGTIELIDSDATVTGYETAIITKYDYEAVVEEVETDDTDIFFTLYTGDLDDIDTESETELVVVYKDGAVVEATAIAAGDTVTTAEIGTTARVLYVSSKSVTGTVEGLDNKGKVGIADEYYAPSEISGYTDTGLFGMEGIFYLNVDGQIAYADASMTKGGYGFILNVYNETVAGKTRYYATVVEADGAVKVYEFAKANKVNGADKTNVTAFEAIRAFMAVGHSSYATAAVANAHVDTAATLLFEVKIKNGEIKELTQVAGTTPTTESKYNEDTKSLGAKTFDETSVMFALEGAAGTNAIIEEENIKVGKVIEMLADGTMYKVALSASALENGIYKAAIGYNLVTSVDPEGEIIVVTGKKTIAYNDGDKATVITGLQAGKEVTVTIYNEDEGAVNTTAAALAVGDIILTSTVNAEGVADNLVVVFDESTGAGSLPSDDTTNKNYYGYQLAVSADDNFIWFGSVEAGIAPEVGVYDRIDTNDDGVADTDVNGYYMVMQKSANCVLVDLPENADEYEISKKSLSKSLIGKASKYNSYVFVRVIDEVIVDVVVYRSLD